MSWVQQFWNDHFNVEKPHGVALTNGETQGFTCAPVHSATRDVWHCGEEEQSITVGEEEQSITVIII